MKTIMNRLGVAMVGALMGLGAVPASAQDQAPSTLEQLLNEARQDRQRLSRENQQRIAEFRRERDQQLQLLRDAQAQQERLEAEADRLEAEQEANEQEINDLKERFAQEQGEFGELFGETRRVAGETAGQLEQSLISAQHPGRQERLREIAATDALPSEGELNAVWEALLEEVVYQGQVQRFTVDVLDGEGIPQPTEVVRVGPFIAVANSGYLQYNEDSQTLERIGRSPSAAASAAANRVFGADEGDGPVRAMLDPSLGAILEAQLRVPSLRERIDQGGIVGYVVIGLAIIGILLGVIRLVMLFLTNMAVRGQVKTPNDPKKGNPLGRVLTAYREHKSEDVETMELRLDEAILRETPKLERGLNTLKVLAAVAPLLGLLGTVTGMIITFQQITLFGTGDPQIMAGGISQALITTVLGLVAAIPLLLLHSFASTSARGVGQILEEQAAGLVAEHAESRAKAG